MASEQEVERQLAELSARIDRLTRSVEALLAANSADRTGRISERTAAVAGRPPVFRPAAQAALPAKRAGRAASGEGRGIGSNLLESRIGSQLLNRVGIFAVLFAVAWFLKLAFDRNWIGPGLRVLIGLGLAAAMLIWSERFRRHGFIAFSYTLKALGTGIGYLSLWAASSVYHLVPWGVAFCAMAALTLLNALLAWHQESELLAVYALAGGLATPALLSFALEREVFLFSYLLMLDMGALLLFALRPWKRLIYAAFAGTLVYGIVWAIRSYDLSAFMTTAIFTAAFFAVFAAAPVLLTREAARKTAPEGRPYSVPLFLVAFPIGNAAAVFSAALILFTDPGHHWLRPWVVFALAAVFSGLAALGPQWSPGPLSNVHIGLAVFFLVVAIPLEFHGVTVALCWLGTALGLIALAATRTGNAMRIYGAAVLALAVLDTILLEWTAPSHGPLPVVANTHFATYLTAAGVLAYVARFSVARLAQSVAEEHRAQPPAFGSWKFLAGFSTICLSLTLLVAVSLEVHHYWFCGASFFQDFCAGAAGEGARKVYCGFSYSAWYIVYGAALMAVGFWRRSAFLRWQAIFLLGFSIAKVFLVDASHLSQGYRVLSFLGLGVVLLAVSFAYQKEWLAFRDLAARQTPPGGDWRG
jgi:uncharacterized membrane protein